ncbi:MAG: adenylate/guanylate cyclase domain-containing protein [Spirochaetia bacterium]
MLDPTLRNMIIEMLSHELSSDQIDEIGNFMLHGHSTHSSLGIGDHITVSSRKAAAALLDECMNNRCEEKLLKFIVELDGEKLLGKGVELKDLERLLNQLAKNGYIYDSKKGKFRKIKESIDDMPNWGALKNGKQYEISVGSIDIAGSSELVKKHGHKKMEKLYYEFWGLLRRILSNYDGRIWSWQGDGGLVAFAFKGHQERCVLFSMELQQLIKVFNINPRKSIPEDIKLRIGLDTGKVKYLNETGKIISDTINYAAHLEKSFSKPGEITISQELLEKVPESILHLFQEKKKFEERTALVCSWIE